MGEASAFMCAGRCIVRQLHKLAQQLRPEGTAPPPETAACTGCPSEPNQVHPPWARCFLL